MNGYIHRVIEKKIKEMNGLFPAILITGARQSGKSTVLQFLAAEGQVELHEVSLDDMRERSLAQSDPELFLRAHEKPLVIDEFQYAPELLSYIKVEIDKARKNEMFGNGHQVGTMYYLTGSQVFETMENVSESLAGRIGIIDLHPLSTREIEGVDQDVFVPDIALIKGRRRLGDKNVGSIYERIFRGSYPELYKKPDLSVEAFFSSYVRTYIERDVRKIVHVQDEPQFMRFISAMAARTGQEYNAADIAKDVGISAETVKKWTSVLTNTYLIFLLQPHSNNNVGRIVKRPKIYFMDTGLACYLTGYVSALTLERSAYSGAIFETYIITEIIKSYSNNQKDPRKHLYYYRDNNKREIDLLIIDEDRIFPVEIKKSANPDKRALKNFDIVQKFEMDSPNGAVICLTEQIHMIDEKNYLIPIEYI